MMSRRNCYPPEEQPSFLLRLHLPCNQWPRHAGHCSEKQVVFTLWWVATVPLLLESFLLPPSCQSFSPVAELFFDAGEGSSTGQPLLESFPAAGRGSSNRKAVGHYTVKNSRWRKHCLCFRETCRYMHRNIPTSFRCVFILLTYAVLHSLHCYLYSGYRGMQCIYSTASIRSVQCRHTLDF